MIAPRATYRLVALAVPLLVLVAGCSSGSTDRSPIRGTVSYNGQPVDNGGIVFLPEGDAEGESRLAPPD